MILIVILLMKLGHRYGYCLCNFAFFDDSSSKEITRKFVFIRKIELKILIIFQISKKLLHFRTIISTQKHICGSSKSELQSQIYLDNREMKYFTINFCSTNGGISKPQLLYMQYFKRHT